MINYNIEVGEKKKNTKKEIIILSIIAIILVSAAIFGGIELAKRRSLAKKPMNSENTQYAQSGQEDNSQSDKENNLQSTNGQVNTNQEKNTNQEQNSSQTESGGQTQNNGNTENNGQNQNNQNGASNNNQPAQNNSGEQNEQEGNTQEVSGSKLTDKQIESIDKIYNSKEKVAYLTFDDGPSSTVTPKILDTLKKENIKATFFVLGTMVKSNASLLKRERAEGHYIANHGYSHVYSKVYANENKPLEEYEKTNKIIAEALGDSTYQANVFRFPGGSVGGTYDKIKTKAKKVLKEKGIAYLDWNCLTNDAAGSDTKEEIMKSLKSTCKGKNSIVVLMHDAPNKKLTAETLPDVIAYLRSQGYSFKNLYDII